MISIGIDRLIIKDIEVKEIHKDYLKFNGHTVEEENGYGARFLKDNFAKKTQTISYMNVTKKKDNTLIFNGFRIGSQKIGEKNYSYYEHLDINLPRVISPTKTNEKNINNKVDYDKAITLTEQELKTMGFGTIKLENTNLKQMEINGNIKLEHEFKEYIEVFEYIRKLLPNRLKKSTNCSHEPKGEYTGFQINNKTMGLKFYNKKVHIGKEDKKDIDELLRIEYTLFNEKKIKSMFNESNKLKDVVKDDFSLIDKAFRTLIQEDLFKKIYKDIDNQVKFALKKLEEYKDIKGISPIDNYLKNHQQELFDIEIVLSALRQTETSNNYSRKAKSTIKSAEEIEGKKLFGNIDKLNEILGALEVEKIEMDMTQGIKKEVEKHY